MLLMLLCVRADEVRRTGEYARAQAHAASVPVYYSTHEHRGEIIEELPDGNRRVLRRIDGIERVVAELGPRADWPSA